MRIQMHLPRVEPMEYDIPAACLHEGCEGRQFKLQQRHYRRAVLDPNQDQNNVRRAASRHRLPFMRVEKLCA